MLDEVAEFFANKSKEPPNLASVSFSIAVLNDVNLLFVSVNVVFVVCIDFKLVCKVVTSSFLTLTKASTHEEVSKPEAKPLNDIVDAIIKILFY